MAQALETGFSGAAAFVVEAPVIGERLSALIARERRLSPFATLGILRSIAAGLEAGLVHGQLAPSLIWVEPNGGAVLSGFSFFEPDPEADRLGVAALAFEMLSGSPFDSMNYKDDRRERIREPLPGLTARIAEVIDLGTAPEGFASLSAFVAAFAHANEGSVADLAAAAHQSMSAGDAATAAMFVEMAHRYDPDNPELTLISMRMATGDSLATLLAEPRLPQQRSRRWIRSDRTPILRDLSRRSSWRP